MLTLADGSQATSRAVVLDTGVSYRRLDIPGLDELSGAGVFYGAGVAETAALKGQEVFVVGGGNSAGSPGHPETAAIERVVTRYRAEGIAYRTLHDGQALLVNGPETKIV